MSIGRITPQQLRLTVPFLALFVFFFLCLPQTSDAHGLPVAVSGPTLTSISISTSSIPGGMYGSGTITLSGNASSSGFPVIVESNSPSVIIVTNQVVGPGTSSATFTVTTLPVQQEKKVTVTAKGAGVTVKTEVVITPPVIGTMGFTPYFVVGGSPSSCGVSLNIGGAPGIVVAKLSSRSPLMKAPSTVTFTASSSFATFTVQTEPVAVATEVTVTATLNGVSKTAVLAINPPTLSSLTVAPAVLAAGASATGTVTISGPAPAKGITVTLGKSYSAIIPSSVLVPEGKTTATFKAEGMAVQAQTQSTVVASLDGSTQSAPLTVNPPSIHSLTLNPSKVVGGKTVTATVSLATPAATGGQIVFLASDSRFAIIPSAVTVPAGQKTVTFTIKTTSVASSTTVVFSANYGSNFQFATLTIT